MKILSGLGVHTVEIGALACHGNPVHLNKEIADGYDKDFREAVAFLQDIIIVEEKPTTMSWA